MNKQIQSEKQLLGDQDAVMAHYQRYCSVSSKRDEQALHMFFSPNRVPKGLTRKQIRCCIDKFPLREWHRAQTADRRRNLDSHVLGRALPEEFSPSKRMTARNFEVGMAKFNADLISLLSAEIGSGFESARVDLPSLLLLGFPRTVKSTR